MGDTVVVCQTNACLLYLGNLLGLNGSTPAARVLNNQVLCEIHDLRNEAIEIVYSFKQRCRSREEFEQAIVSHLRQGCVAAYRKLDDFYGMTSGGPYLAGRNICSADFHVWEMLDQHEIYARKLEQPSPLGNFHRLRIFYLT